MGRTVYLDNQPKAEALANYLAALGDSLRGRREMIPVSRGLGRILAQAAMARISSPHFPASAMDGLALRAVDTFGASETNPVVLNLPEQGEVVDTGDPIPHRFDAVIMVEKLHFIDEDQVEIREAASPGQHVRAVGEDIVATEMILPANHRLRPWDLGGLLAGGVLEVEVYARPRVAILPTGTEIVPPTVNPARGELIDFNSATLAGMVVEWGGEPEVFPITADQRELLKERILQAVADCDVVIINAGSSAGREDFTAGLIRELGVVYTHGVAIKPGKPVILGQIQGKPVLGIPGYPVSAFLTADLFAQPLVRRLAGDYTHQAEKVEAVLTRKTPSPLGVEEYLRVKLGQVGDRLVATPISRGAGIIMSLVRADGILAIPPSSEGIHPGEKVEVRLLRPLGEIGGTVVSVGSHDLIQDLLADRLHRKHPEFSLASAHVGSTGGLLALRRGECHMAGIHLLGEASGEYNVPFIEGFLPEISLVLVNVVYREQGLIVPKGNPEGIRELADLVRPGISLVNRQKGSGTRILLDYLLRKAGLQGEDIPGYGREEMTHMAVAAAVHSGAASAGVGIAAAAHALGLDFVPLARERYDLCIPREHLELPQMQALLAILRGKDFQEQVAALRGYHTEDCGQVVWSQH